MMRSLFALLALALVLVVSRAGAAYTPPPLQGAVTDTASALTAAEKKDLEASLAAYRAKTTNEIVVFVLASLGGETIEDVAYKAFNTWKIGKKGKDNGVLLVIAMQDHKLRIETGKGVGGLLTDIESSHINRDRIAPLLRAGKTHDAIAAGITAIEAALDGRPPPPSDPRELIRGPYWIAMPGLLGERQIRDMNVAASKDPIWSGANVIVALVDEIANRGWSVTSADAIAPVKTTVIAFGANDGKVAITFAGVRQSDLEELASARLNGATTIDAALAKDAADQVVQVVYRRAQTPPPPPPPAPRPTPGFPTELLLFLLPVTLGGLAMLVWFFRPSRRSGSTHDGDGPDSDSWRPSDDSSTSDDSSSPSFFSSSSDSTYSSSDSSSSSSSDSSSSSSSDSSSSSYSGGGGESGGGGSSDSW